VLCDVYLITSANLKIIVSAGCAKGYLMIDDDRRGAPTRCVRTMNSPNGHVAKIHAEPMEMGGWLKEPLELMGKG